MSYLFSLVFAFAVSGYSAFWLPVGNPFPNLHPLEPAPLTIII